MSYMKKLIMSPAMGFRCQSCGKVMAVDMRKALGLVIFCGVLSCFAFQFFFANFFMVLAFSLVTVAVVYGKIIPLVEAKDNFKYFE